MNKIDILLTEDDPIIAADIKRAAEKMGFSARAVYTGTEAIEYCRHESPDLLIMDINLGEEPDGIETVRRIHTDQDIPVIFLTANDDYATFTRAKTTGPHAFLSKPFREYDLRHSIELALLAEKENTEEAEKEDAPAVRFSHFQDSIFVKEKEWLTKIPFADIQWIEASGCYSKIKTDTKEITVVGILKKFEEKMRDSPVVRTHRSYLVNVEKVEQIRDGFLKIGDKVIPVGRSYRKTLKNMFPTI